MKLASGSQGQTVNDDHAHSNIHAAIIIQLLWSIEILAGKSARAASSLGRWPKCERIRTRELRKMVL